MTAIRQISVCDGQRSIGTIYEYGDKTCIARDADGKKLGKFPNFQKAADAICDVDKIFGVQRDGVAK